MNLTIQLFEWLNFDLSGNKLLAQFVVNLSIYSHSLRTLSSFDATLYGQIQPAVTTADVY